MNLFLFVVLGMKSLNGEYIYHQPYVFLCFSGIGKTENKRRVYNSSVKTELNENLQSVENIHVKWVQHR